MTADERRSARLLFAREIAAGDLSDSALSRPEVARAVRSRRVPPRPIRVLQRAGMKAGLWDFESISAAFDSARRAALGAAAAGEPRLLVRVDEFPHANAYEARGSYGTEAFLRFHELMADAGVEYLVAVSPRVSRDHLDPALSENRGLAEPEMDLLRRLRSEGVAMGMHGRTHRTRDANPRRHSELAGLSTEALTELLEVSARELAQVGIETPVFVPPFNRFDAGQWPVLAKRFQIVCGGPENVLQLGLHRSPLWRGEAVYMPAYEPFYAVGPRLAPAVNRLHAQQRALWVPVVLHWGWEAAGGWDSVRGLARLLGRFAQPWSRFLEEIEASGAPATG